MGWVSERWAVFSEAAGPRRYLIGGIITLAVTAADFFKPILGDHGMAGLIGIPSWVAGIFVALLIIAFWLLEYAVRLRRIGRGARLELAKLRRIGVRLRNDGSRMSDEADVRNWLTQVDKRHDDVLACLRLVNEADAEWFRVLDTVPSPRHERKCQITDDKLKWQHEKAFREHDYRLFRLDQLVQADKYNGRGADPRPW
jgi:hypothetical protein